MSPVAHDPEGGREEMAVESICIFLENFFSSPELNEFYLRPVSHSTRLRHFGAKTSINSTNHKCQRYVKI